MKLDGIWFATSPVLAAGCLAGVAVFAGWLVVRRVERRLNLHAGLE